MSDLATAVSFVLNSATRDDIERLADAIRTRQKVLRAEAAAAVTVGMTAKIEGISPKYLNGMVGEVVSIEGSAATVRLDKASTSKLRGTQRFGWMVNEEEHPMGGIPLSTLREVA